MLDACSNAIHHHDPNQQLYFLDIQLKNFDQLYFHESLSSIHEIQDQIMKVFHHCDIQPIACDACSFDHFQCIYPAPSKSALLALIGQIDDGIHQLDDPRIHQRLFLGIGIDTIHPKDDLFTCMRNARLAREQSNDANKLHTHIEWYQDQLRFDLLQRRHMEHRMYQAIGTHDFQMVIQPKISCRNQRVCGGEALIRMPFSDGMDSDTFHMITLAENNGLIEDIDLMMFQEVCKYQTQVLKQQLPFVPISVNVSRIHFQKQDFFDSYLAIYRSYDLPNGCIELEITESAQSVLLQAPLADMIEQFHKAGFGVALDDFGSGVSSLGLLSTLSIDTLKLDRSFFLHESAASKMIVEMILTLAKQLSFQTVAEGIENAEQVKFLSERGCDMIQGFYYAKPMAVQDFIAFLKQQG